MTKDIPMSGLEKSYHCYDYGHKYVYAYRQELEKNVGYRDR